jgi:hypothetical protein
MAEVLAALLATDLDLPVPEPFLVRMEPGLAASIPDTTARQRAQSSPGLNFGSKKLPPGFMVYPAGKPIPKELAPTAADILAFDTFIANPDRTAANPNLLFNGRELAIYDHELALFMDGLIGWKPPWQPGGVQFPKGQPPKIRHVFLEDLRGSALDFDRLTGAFEAITAGRLTEYRQALPEEWVGEGQAAGRIMEYIAQLKENIKPAINRLTEALQ